MNKKDFFTLVKISFKDWQADNATLRAAALTFFIILPLPSLLLIVIAIFAQFCGQTQATQQLIQQITSVAGPAVAGLFSELLASAMSPFTSVWASITVVGFSLAGAIGAFAVLRDTMDVIWEVSLPKRLSLTKRIRQKIVPFALVSSLGLIVIAWTGIITTIFSALRLIPVTGFLTTILVSIFQIVLSFAVATLLFAIIYKMIPEAKVQWRDVALASIVTALAFTVTNYIFGTYIQTFTVTTIIGAAGSLMIILLWIFVINEIVLFGAELSKVYASTFGSHAKKALPVVKKVVEQIEKPLEKAEEKKAEERVVETKDKVAEKKEELAKPEKEDKSGGETTVEVDIKIKSPSNDKQKGQS